MTPPSVDRVAAVQPAWHGLLFPSVHQIRESGQQTRTLRQTGLLLQAVALMASRVVITSSVIVFPSHIITPQSLHLIIKALNWRTNSQRVTLQALVLHLNIPISCYFTSTALHFRGKYCTSHSD